MSDSVQNDDEFVETNLELLELLELRKFRNRFVFCKACGEETLPGPINICAECLADDCDEFLKQASAND